MRSAACPTNHESRANWNMGMSHGYPPRRMAVSTDCAPLIKCEMCCTPAAVVTLHTKLTLMQPTFAVDWVDEETRVHHAIAIGKAQLAVNVVYMQTLRP